MPRQGGDRSDPAETITDPVGPEFMARRAAASQQRRKCLHDALEAWRPASSQRRGTLVVTFSLTRGYAVPGTARAAKTASRGRSMASSPGHRWQRLVYSGKVELGADVRTAFARMWGRAQLPVDRYGGPGRHGAHTGRPDSASLFIQNGGNQLVGPPQRRAVRCLKRPRPSSIATLHARDRDGVVIAKNEQMAAASYPRNVGRRNVACAHPRRRRTA